MHQCTFDMIFTLRMILLFNQCARSFAPSTCTPKFKFELKFTLKSNLIFVRTWPSRTFQINECDFFGRILMFFRTLHDMEFRQCQNNHGIDGGFIIWSLIIMINMAIFLFFLFSNHRKQWIVRISFANACSRCHVWWWKKDHFAWILNHEPKWYVWYLCHF